MTDPVFHPKHYIALGIECIDMIYAVSTPEEFCGYCRGCALKYRFRAGQKGDALEDIAKAKQYERWFELVASGDIGNRKPSETVTLRGG